MVVTARLTPVIPSEREESPLHTLEEQIPHYVRDDSLSVTP
jgi:hypothetical protein